MTDADVRAAEVGGRGRVLVTRFGHRLAGRGALVGAMVAGVAVRLALVLIGSGTERFTNADTSSYVGFARSLPTILWSPDRQGLIWSIQRTPGYPLALWVLSLGGTVHLTWVVVVQAVVGGALTVGLCGALGRRVAGPVAGGAAAWLLALDPTSVGHSLLVGTETLFTVGWVVVLLGLERLARAESGPVRGRAAAIGAGVGALALVRPVLLYAAPVLAVLVWWVLRRPDVDRPRGAPWAAAGLLVVAAAVPVGAWFARNDGVADAWVFSSVQGQNLFDIGAAAMAADEGRMSVRPGDTGDGWAELDAAKQALWDQHAAELARVDMGDPVVQEREWGRMGRQAILDHPRGYATVVGQSLVRTVAGPAHSLVVAQLPASWQDGASPVVAVTAAMWLALEYLLAAVGVVAAWVHRRRRTLAVLVVPAAYYLLISAGPQMYARFRVPVAPILCVLAGWGVARLVAGRGATEAPSDGAAAPAA